MELWEQLIRPMLAFSSKPFDSKEWLSEIKFDGTRAIAYVDVEGRSVRLLNRRLKFFELRYPELQPLWRDIRARKAILDGEVVVFERGKPNFYKLAEREHVESRARIELLSRIMPATYVVFDILLLNNSSLVDRPLIKRKKILERAVRESERVLLSRFVIGSGRRFFRAVRRRGLEGIVTKRLNSSYQIGRRSKDWLKIKALKSLDCLICGYTEGKGWRRRYFGALLCGVYHQNKLRYIGRVGTGWSERDMAELMPALKRLEVGRCPFEIFKEGPAILERVHWTTPKLVAEVKFMGLSKELKMRAPSFLRLRRDKPPSDCTLEV
jgi:DNA ligase D-like protein (predicted ligase)